MIFFSTIARDDLIEARVSSSTCLKLLLCTSILRPSVAKNAARI